MAEQESTNEKKINLTGEDLVNIIKKLKEENETLKTELMKMNSKLTTLSILQHVVEAVGLEGPIVYNEKFRYKCELKAQTIIDEIAPDDQYLDEDKKKLLDDYKEFYDVKTIVED